MMVWKMMFLFQGARIHREPSRSWVSGVLVWIGISSWHPMSRILFRWKGHCFGSPVRTNKDATVMCFGNRGNDFQVIWWQPEIRRKKHLGCRKNWDFNYQPQLVIAGFQPSTGIPATKKRIQTWLVNFVEESSDIWRIHYELEKKNVEYHKKEVDRCRKW